MNSLERNKRRLTFKELRRQDAMKKLTLKQKTLLETDQSPDLDEFVSLLKYVWILKIILYCIYYNKNLLFLQSYKFSWIVAYFCSYGLAPLASISLKFSSSLHKTSCLRSYYWNTICTLCLLQTAREITKTLVTFKFVLNLEGLTWNLFLTCKYA